MRMYPIKERGRDEGLFGRVPEYSLVLKKFQSEVLKPKSSIKDSPH